MPKSNDNRMDHAYDAALKDINAAISNLERAVDQRDGSAARSALHHARAARANFARFADLSTSTAAAA